MISWHLFRKASVAIVVSPIMLGGLLGQVTKAEMLNPNSAANQSSKLSTSSANDEKVQPSVLVPKTVSTSAQALGSNSIVADCSAVMTVPIRLPHCPSAEKLPDSEGGSELGLGISPDLLRDAEREINQSVQHGIRSQNRDSVKGIAISLP